MLLYGQGKLEDIQVFFPSINKCTFLTTHIHAIHTTCTSQLPRHTSECKCKIKVASLPSGKSKQIRLKVKVITELTKYVLTLNKSRKTRTLLIG